MKKKTLIATMTEVSAKYQAIKMAGGVPPVLVVSPTLSKWAKFHGVSLTEYVDKGPVFVAGGFERYLLITLH